VVVTITRRPAGVAGAGRPARVLVDRLSPADLMELAVDVGPAPMIVGAVLVLSTRAGFGVEQARRLPGERITVVPRLRQRLYRAPPGCGRPFWADDPAFDLCHHVRQVPCPAPGDQRALLDVAAAVPFPAPAPGAGTLAAEAWAGRARRLAHPAGSIRTIGQGWPSWAAPARRGGCPGRR
jgi:Wax ester synthase/diacylglycerol acyltransferase catalytic domain